jgi:hypothetical protein
MFAIWKGSASMPLINGFLWTMLILAAFLGYQILNSFSEAEGRADPERPFLETNKPKCKIKGTGRIPCSQQKPMTHVALEPCKTIFRFYEIDSDSVQLKAG